jgi:hypothetical protein
MVFDSDVSNICNYTYMLYSVIVKANEVGGACGTHGRGEKSVQSFGG